MRKLSVWKLLCIGIVPVVLYQIFWAYYLKSLPQQFWLRGPSSQLLLIKGIGELVMYSAMLWFLIWGTKTSLSIIQFILSTLLTGVILYTGYSLLRLS